MEIYAFTSYGNDSIALIQWLREHNGEGVEVTTLYSDTGWAAAWWAERVERAEAWVRSIGFKSERIPSEGFVPLAIRKKGFPRNGMQFCTSELKILPAMRWLDARDPDKEGVCAVGVRREESRSRQAWPEWVEESDKHGGRSLWSPLVTYTSERRDELIRRAGFDPLPHRSMECFPCINSSRSDLRMLDEARAAEIESLEQRMGVSSEGKPRTLFRPYRHQGAVGIQEVLRWAHAERGEYEPPTAGCDSGFCGG